MRQARKKPARGHRLFPGESRVTAGSVRGLGGRRCQPLQWDGRRMVPLHQSATASAAAPDAPAISRTAKAAGSVSCFVSDGRLSRTASTIRPPRQGNRAGRPRLLARQEIPSELFRRRGIKAISVNLVQCSAGHSSADRLVTDQGNSAQAGGLLVDSIPNHPRPAVLGYTFESPKVARHNILHDG